MQVDVNKGWNCQNLESFDWVHFQSPAVSRPCLSEGRCPLLSNFGDNTKLSSDKTPEKGENLQQQVGLLRFRNVSEVIC